MRWLGDVFAMTRGIESREIEAGFAALPALVCSFISAGFTDAQADTPPLQISIGCVSEAIPEQRAGTQILHALGYDEPDSKCKLNP
jgi:hypothetical protein